MSNGQAQPAKVIVDLQAGVIPNQIETSKRFVLDADEANDPDAWSRVHGQAMHYCLALQNPEQFNWVRLEWTFL